MTFVKNQFLIPHLEFLIIKKRPADPPAFFES